MSESVSESQVDRDTRTKILFIVPSLRSGGAERQVVDLANGLDSSRYDKSIAVFESNHDQLGRIDRGQVDFIALHRRYKLDFSAARQLAKIIDREEVDIVHCSLQIAVLMGWLAVFWSSRKPKLIAAVHTTTNRSLKYEFFDRVLYRRLLRTFQKIIFVCNSQADHWLEKYPELAPISRVVHNGVDPSLFDRADFLDDGRKLRQRRGIPEGVKVIVCVAGFRPEKGHSQLVTAFARLSGQPHLVLAGDGEMRSAIETLVSSLGVGSRVHFIGNVVDVRPVLAIADLTVLASTAVETFSLAMLESMSMCVPVVATDIGGLREAIHSGETGELVSPGRLDDLTAKLQGCLDSGRLDEMGRAGRQLVVSKFSHGRMISNTDAVIAELATRTPERATQPTRI